MKEDDIGAAGGSDPSHDLLDIFFRETMPQQREEQVSDPAKVNVCIRFFHYLPLLFSNWMFYSGSRSILHWSGSLYF